MKKTLILLILAIITISMKNFENTNLFSLSKDGLITYDEKNIDYKVKTKNIPQDYEHRDSVVFTVGDAEYILKIGNRWPIHDSPGDYNIMQFFINGEEKLYFEDADWLIKYKNSQIPKSHVSQFSKYANNPYFISVPLTDTSIALIFMGPNYSTNVSRMAIFVLTESDIKLILNKELEATKIIKSSTEFKMTVVSQPSQLISMNPEKWSEPVTHEIYLEDGVLKFKDN